MIELDYGKEAYVKLQELKKKVENLEKIQSKFHYNELRFNLGEDYNITKFERSFTIDALNEGKHYFKFVINAEILNLTGVITDIYVNDVICCTFANIINGEFPFTISPTLIKGENSIKIVMNSALEFDINSITATICGLVDYSKMDYSLSLATCGIRNYIITKTPSEIKVRYYYSNDSLKTIFLFSAIYLLIIIMI